jgi:hypothetical protein
MQVAKRLNAVGIVTPLHKHSCHFHGTIHHGAEHTKVKRATSPTARFFHVLNFVESGINPHSYWFWGWECLTARRQHGFTHVFKPSPTIALNRRMVVFKSRKGVKTMTILTPKTGNSHHAHATSDSKTLLFIATILGILCTWAIFSYSIDNLDGLGLSPEIKKARTIEIIVFVFGEVFLALAIGRVHKTHPEWATKLAAVWLILLVIDFWGSYQARNAISLQQTLTRSATESHADLIKKQLEVNQTAAKELSDSSARQRANKMITGSAQSAMQASKQADAGMELVKAHEAAIKGIKPTEADTFGAWNGTVIFISIFALYALNTLMWAFIGEFSNAAIPSPVTKPSPLDDSVTPATVTHDQTVTPHRDDSVTPKPNATAVTFDLEKAKEAVQKKNAIEWMPKIKPWQFAVPAAVVAAGAAHAQTPQAPVMPVIDDSVTPAIDDSVTPLDQTVTPKAPRKRAVKPVGVQMDTGTTGKASHRYKRVKLLVESRKTRPSVRQLMALDGEQINADRAREYLDAMIRDGVLIKSGIRWDYAPAIDPRQIELGGL